MMTADEKMEIAQQMQLWREQRNLSVKEAASILGLSPRTIEGIEQGRGFGYLKIFKLAMKAVTHGQA